MDERNWTDQPLMAADTIDGNGVRVARQDTGCQSLISGDLETALALLAPGASMLGFAQTPKTSDHAIRIARDQALLITAAPPMSEAGWNAKGFAFSPAGGRFACLSLIGPNALDLLAHGTNSAPPTGSPSAALRFAGTSALVTGNSDGLNLWIERGHLTFVTGFLQRVAETMDGV